MLSEPWLRAHGQSPSLQGQEFCKSLRSPWSKSPKREFQVSWTKKDKQFRWGLYRIGVRPSVSC